MIGTQRIAPSPLSQPGYVLDLSGCRAYPSYILCRSALHLCAYPSCILCRSALLNFSVQAALFGSTTCTTYSHASSSYTLSTGSTQLLSKIPRNEAVVRIACAANVRKTLKVGHSNRRNNAVSSPMSFTSSPLLSLAGEASVTYSGENVCTI